MVEQVPRPQTLTELAYQQLRDGILEGGLAAGSRVSVVSLAADMGMSRSPVRAAIERLATDGLMILTPGGALVPTPGRGDLLDALAVRAPLEGLAARLAAPQLADSDVAVLSDIHAEFDAAVRQADTTTAQRADLRFHQQVQAYCGNECLVEHLERVQARVILATYSTAWSSNQMQAVPEHARILSALSARDGEAAGRAATVHLENLAERVRREWRRRDSEESRTA
ncbi:GntR family transcriptional regulator [Sciscionella sediminilitoris]|uniref:GntR family transcriptional regulator n=1 Tax=Sciscionella sediminilitoris TaxID=1445613 RepID=UPI000689D3CF|nr:GntR family transcriptional regulator [Sciscionella sp. SE31]